MPLTLRDGEAPEVAGGGEEEGLGEVAVVIVVVPAAFAAQHHHRFGALPVAVDRQHGAGLDGVEHALGTVLGAVAEVAIVTLFILLYEHPFKFISPKTH